MNQFTAYTQNGLDAIARVIMATMKHKQCAFLTAFTHTQQLITPNEPWTPTHISAINDAFLRIYGNDITCAPHPSE